MSLVLRAIIALSALMFATAAPAVTVTLNPDPLVEGRYSTSFAATHPVPDAYADTFDFVSPVDGLLSVTLHSPVFTGSVGIGFFAYQLSGTPPVGVQPAQSDLDIGPLSISAGPHTLTVGAVVFSAPPGITIPMTYTGSLSITALPIPEPETWLLMSVGLLVVIGCRLGVVQSRPRLA